MAAAGLGLSGTDCPGWGSAPAGVWCAALQQSPAGILADTARNVPKAVRGDAAKSDSTTPKKVLAVLSSREPGQRRGRERREVATLELLGVLFVAFWGVCHHYCCQPHAA